MEEQESGKWDALEGLKGTGLVKAGVTILCVKLNGVSRLSHPTFQHPHLL